MSGHYDVDELEPDRRERVSSNADAERLKDALKQASREHPLAGLLAAYPAGRLMRRRKSEGQARKGRPILKWVLIGIGVLFVLQVLLGAVAG